MATAEEEAAQELSVLLRKYSEAFDNLTMERHKAGAEEYGYLSFLENDVVRMMAEELADTANYCRMQFIKLMIMNDFILETVKEHADEDGNITLGVKAFRGAGGAGWMSP